MTVRVLTHPDCLKHEMGPSHPESPARLEAINQVLKAAPWADQLDWIEAPLALKEQLKLAHDSSYVESLFLEAPKEGYVQCDPDTLMNPYTLSAALRASGAVIAAVDDVFAGRTKRAFCAVRPPGHHAEPDTAMGFCFFNNIAVGARHAMAKYNCQRIAIVDFDVHHGNGTESIFLNDARVCFWSSFQHPFYPGTFLTDKPRHIHLCPLPANTGSQIFRQKIDLELIPILLDFKPECIFISAGFDAHHLDPLANLKLTSEDFGYVTKAVCEVADKVAGGKVISSLEGGYHLKALQESVIAHVEALLN